MRVAVVSPSLEVRGAERIAVDLAVHLRTAGDDVTVIAPHGPLQDALHAAGVVHRPIGDRRRSLPGAAVTVIELARLLRACDPDVVHAHNPKMSGLVSVACARRRPPPGGARSGPSWARSGAFTSLQHRVAPDGSRRGRSDVTSSPTPT